MNRSCKNCYYNKNNNCIKKGIRAADASFCVESESNRVNKKVAELEGFQVVAENLTDTEMARMLFDNIDLIAIDEKGNEYIVEKSEGELTASKKLQVVSKDNGNILWYVREKWQVLRPIKPKKLKEFTFAEVLSKLELNEYAITDVKSVVSGFDFNMNLFDLSTDEFEGMWTIEGVYDE